jgi:hypothetical protein
MKPERDPPPGARRLAAWLDEWHLERRLQAADPDAPPARRAPIRYPAPRAGAAVRAGQIRLLPPATPATAARPVYVAVLAPAGPERWQVAPFGRFATPALPGEYATRRRALPLSVLCAWNAGVAGAALLRASYPAGRLTAAERRACGALLAVAGGGAPPPADVARRTGPPLVHPLDPRHAYVEEERALWLEIGAAAAAPGGARPFDELRLAAEEPEGRYGKKGSGG